MRNVYLINVSFGLAGTERRFANIWHALRQRGNVRPILVVPDTLAEILYRAGLATPGDESLWVVKEWPIFRLLARMPLGHVGRLVLAAVRSRIVAWSYRSVWGRIRRDPSAVIHVGLNCSGLTPPDAPIVYEAVDANLTQLGSRHYVKAAARPSIIHCQTKRIQNALELVMRRRKPIWTTVSSPSYFASYPEENLEVSRRDPSLIAYVGRFAPEKNPLLFVDALARLRANDIPFCALMLGEGPLHGEIVSRLERHGLSSAVSVGFSQRPSERLREAAVYVSLQEGDNYGSQSLLEAMGAGCAIVATDVGETRRLIGPEVGLLVNADLAQLTQALTTLLVDQSRTARMGAAASTLARTQYTADRYAIFLESLYARAIERRAAFTAASDAASTPLGGDVRAVPHS